MKAGILSISDYSTMPNLPYVLEDTKQIKDALLKMHWDIDEWNKDDKYNLVYVASHGKADGIVLSNGDLEPLKRFITQNCLTIFSVCYTGQSLIPIPLSGDYISLDNGLIISAATQAAYEIPEIKGSILTECFCEEILYWKNKEWFFIDKISTLFLQNLLDKTKSAIRKYTGGWQSSPVIGRLKPVIDIVKK